MLPERDKPTLLMLNGSLRGRQGNTAQVLEFAGRYALSRATVRHIELATFAGPTEDLVDQVCKADALLLGTGIYWNSHGSALQRFLEVLTGWETDPVLWGKPAGAICTVDSVGGSDVAARLLHTLSLMGCWVPPLSSVVISRLGLASRNATEEDDVWGIADVEVLVDNLLLAAQMPRQTWRRWGIKGLRQHAGPYTASGLLQIDGPPWPHL